MVTAMRHLALLLALAACSAAPAPTRCTPGASVACICPGVGTGAQVCAADGSSYGACACGVDGGGDAAEDVTPAEDRPALDAVADDRPDVVAAVDVVDASDRQTPPTDDGRDPGCPETAPRMCSGGSCWNLQTSNGMVPALNCGACGVACPTSAPECVAGRCTAPARDAGAPDAAQCAAPEAPAMCSPGSCWNLQTSNGRVPATHCGECGYACPSAAPECVAGRCTALAPDAGR